MTLARCGQTWHLARRSQWCTVAVLGLLATYLVVATGPVALAQLDYEGGTIRTKDLGYGVLDVKYFNEQSASGTGGCLHVEVSSPSGPSSRERNLEIVFYVNFVHGTSKDGTAYRIPMRLPEGAKRAEIAMPYVSPGQVTQPGNQIIVTLWDIGIAEDGRNIEATRSYSGSRAQASPIATSAGKRNPFHVTTSNSAAWSVLRLVDDNVVPTSLQPEMLRLLEASQNGGPNGALANSLIAKTNFGLSSDWQSVGNIRALSTAPDQWLYYLQFHFVVLDEAVLKNMRTQHPGVNDAIKKYVAAGGSVLLLGTEHRGQQLVDEWLHDSAISHSAAPTSAASGEWEKLTAPMEAWWNRRSASAAAAAQLQGMAMAGATSAAGQLPASPLPGAPPPTNDPRVSPLSGTQAGAPAASTTSPSAAEIGPLSVAGCARDLLTAAQTYSMAKYGTPLFVAQRVIDLVTGNGDSMAVSGMPMTQSNAAGFAAVAFEMEQALAPFQESLERAVTELQSRETVGCSVRAYGLGKVGVVQPGLNAQPIENVRELTLKLDDSASKRISSTRDGAWPWRNLIGSVGKPPVWTFCAFVLLFGLLLGPGLLIFTGWMGRRSLLIFFVPFVSLLATLSIAAYEVLHEGFDTYIRVSSVVTLDERTGQGFAWSRQSYFSGWPPRDGLEFPAGVYFRPVTAQEDIYRSELPEPRSSVGNRIEVGGESSRWTGWLDARQQQQLLIGHPAKPAVPLRVTRADAQHVKIKNLTTQRLPFAAVRDDADGYYLASDLLPGSEVDCAAQTAYEVGIELTRLRGKYVSTAPMEMQGARWGWGRRYVAYTDDMSSSEVLDAAWQQYTSEFLHLPCKGFVTLQESSDAIYVPLKGKITESRQLVVGRLVW